MAFEPNQQFFGGYGPQDGTVDFYGRINSILRPDMVVLDLGAGRGAWYEDDPCTYRKSLRTLRNKVARVIAIDVDDAVLSNRSADECRVMVEGRIPLENDSVDLVVADYVLEHVVEPARFAAEIDRVLKKGGYFCARTPHKWNYVSVFARLVPNSGHFRVTTKAQPDRKAEDVFPTANRLNLLSSVRAYYPSYASQSFVYRTEPAYFFGSRMIHAVQHFLHRILPASLVGNLFVFLKKT